MAPTKNDKDPSRAERKLKKRKFEQAIPDLPGDMNSQDVPFIDDQEHSTTKRRLGRTSNHDANFLRDDAFGFQQKNAKERKKGKRSLKESEINTDKKVNSEDNTSDFQLESCHVNEKRGFESKGDSAPPTNEDLPAKRTKKERKAERKAAEAAQAFTRIDSAPPPTEDQPIAGDRETPPGKPRRNNRNREKKRNSVNGTEFSEKVEGKAPRFIVFIGNLPFSSTTESIQHHFAAVHPKSVRHLTKKDEPEKSKGFAFLEFEGYDHMKACLKSFHHSMFDDGISPPRKINVELTAGGGGGKQNRRTKINEKNQKLNEQRMRRMHEDEKTKLVKRDSAIDHSDVHPSRRARVPVIL